MPSTYVYASFVSNLVLARSVVAGKMSMQTLLFDHLVYWPHIVWAHYHHVCMHLGMICSMQRRRNGNMYDWEGGGGGGRGRGGGGGGGERL